MKTLPPRSLLLALSTLALGADLDAQAGAGGFQAGDLYLYSVAIDAFSGGGAIVHVDPITGQSAMFHDLPTTTSFGGALCYDPWRDRLIWYGGFAPNSAQLHASDAAGNAVSLGYSGAGGSSIKAMTARGDGLIYCLSGSFHPGPAISYLDQANQFHFLLDGSGSIYNVFAQLDYLQYDAPTNSLVGVSYSNLSECPAEQVDSINVFVYGLSADGARVLSESCFNYEILPGAQLELPRGLSQGPNGDLLLFVGTDSTGGDQRMARLDLNTLSATPFASNNYAAPGENLVRAGTYSTALDKAVLLDPFNDVLRAYAAGESGEGTIVTSSGVSLPGISSENATLIEAGQPAPKAPLYSHLGSLSLQSGGSQPLFLDLGASAAGSLYLLLGSSSGTSPGTPAGGFLLPLVADGYFAFTLANANTPPLPNSLGSLDANGRAQLAFDLPAGSDSNLAGLVLHHAAVIVDASLNVSAVTNALPLGLLP